MVNRTSHNLNRVKVQYTKKPNPWFVALFIIGALAAIIASVYYIDINWCLVGGITEIVRGAQAHPVSVSDIVYGSLRVLLTAIGSVFSITISYLLGVFLFDK